MISVSASSLDAAGLHRSNLAALGEALAALGAGYDLALVDGFGIGAAGAGLSTFAEETASAPPAAASVLAKVTRDRPMRALHHTYPAYGFHEHVGYATTQHRRALAANGASPAAPALLCRCGWAVERRRGLKGRGQRRLGPSSVGAISSRVSAWWAWPRISPISGPFPVQPPGQHPPNLRPKAYVCRKSPFVSWTRGRSGIETGGACERQV